MSVRTGVTASFTAERTGSFLKTKPMRALNVRADKAVRVMSDYYQQLPDAIMDQASEDIDRAMMEFEERARADAPVETGALQGSITRESSRTDTTFVSRVWTNIRYAPFMEYGFVHWISGEKLGPFPQGGFFFNNFDRMKQTLLERLNRYL